MKHILIVEDDPFLSEMYTAKLIQAGFHVETVGDGEAALKKIEERKPDLVLLDLVLPKLDGFEFLKIARRDQKFQDLKIVAFTNLGQKEEVERGLNLGANEYIIKAHFTPTEVVEKIKDILKL